MGALLINLCRIGRIGESGHHILHGFGLLQFQYSIFHCVCQAFFEKESEDCHGSRLTKQPPLNLGTDSVVNGQMVLLHHKGLGRGDADGDVAGFC